MNVTLLQYFKTSIWDWGFFFSLPILFNRSCKMVRRSTTKKFIFRPKNRNLPAISSLTYIVTTIWKSSQKDLATKTFSIYMSQIGQMGPKEPQMLKKKVELTIWDWYHRLGLTSQIFLDQRNLQHNVSLQNATIGINSLERWDKKASCWNGEHWEDNGGRTRIYSAAWILDELPADPGLQRVGTALAGTW